MYITFDNIQFEVRLATQHESVCIESKHGDCYVLCVPVAMPEKELYAFLKVKAKQLVNSFERNADKILEVDILLYNNRFRYRNKINTSVSFRENKTIYSSISASTARNIRKIRNEILFADIKAAVGIWEERLGKFVDTVSLRNYKAKAFQINHKNQTISFAEELINKDLNYVDFIIATAVLDFFKMDAHAKEYLLDEYVQDWKHSLRVYEYERNECN